MHIKMLRNRFEMSQQQLAKKMNTTQQTIARWETGKTALNVNQIKDLCLVLQCSAEELLGWTVEPEDIRESPFASSDTGAPYGTLRIDMTFGMREYPVDENARASLLAQLQSLGPMDGRRDRALLSTWTLNNKILLINPRHLVKLELLSDAVEAMPTFENPEVYRTLEDWPSEELGSNMNERCSQLTAELDEEEIEQLTTFVQTTYVTGRNDWSFLNEEVATEWHTVISHSLTLKQNTFVQIEDENYDQTSFANLDQISMVEIPSGLYGRLTSPA